jgi:hypothetical protein
MKRREKIDNLILDIYRELYKKATPPADFDKLVENATLNERGQKEIPFMDYEIEDSVMNDILRTMTTRKACGMILNTHEKRLINFQIILGCSPKSKHNE